MSGVGAIDRCHGIRRPERAALCHGGLSPESTALSKNERSAPRSTTRYQFGRHTLVESWEVAWYGWDGTHFLPSNLVAGAWGKSVDISDNEKV